MKTVAAAGVVDAETGIDGGVVTTVVTEGDDKRTAPSSSRCCYRIAEASLRDETSGSTW